MQDFDFDAAARIATPFAVIGIFTRDEKLLGVQYLPPTTPTYPARDRLAQEASRQIRAYLTDPRYRFDLPCDPRGTAFQMRVWREIANPIPLIVPCHRVVAANGELGGFMHSRARLPLDIKRWLLSHEGR